MKKITKILILCLAVSFALLTWYIIDLGYVVHEDIAANRISTTPFLLNSSNKTSDISADVSTDVSAEVSANLLRRGEYLTRIGNCAGCHTNNGGALYAGGKIIQSQFGRFIAPNITPDRKTGIGQWTADNFWQALHFGKAPDGSLLYPAFPYTSYTQVSREDSDAMFAYLQSIPAVSQPSLPHQLRFPYNQRPLLAIWRALYFRPQLFQANAGKSQQWNRGAYLVNGLGHCSACHSSRNMLGANAGSNDLDGGELPVVAWYAPSLLRLDEAHLSNLSQSESINLFRKGVANKAAFSGPMSEVLANSLQYFSDSDIEALTHYLRELPQKTETAPDWLDTLSSGSSPTSVTKPEMMAALMLQGAALYKTHCADCHGAAGEGVPGIYPAMKQNRALQMKNVANPIRVVLNGGFPAVSKHNERPYGMPPFGPVLSDNEVALVLTYVRNSWGNHGNALSTAEVNRYRNAPVN